MQRNTIHKISQILASYFKSALIIILLLFAQRAFSINNNLTFQAGEKPLEIAVTLYLNKIYNVNTVDETYQVDGYLEYTWVDNNFKNLLEDTLSNPRIFENDKAREIMNTILWVPALELMNIQGSSEKPNISIELHPDGKVVYDERFLATFSTDMDFRKFPFDAQTFKVVLGPFSFDKRYVVLKDPIIFPVLEESHTLLKTWKITSMENQVKDEISENPYDSENPTLTYSTVVFEIRVSRLSGYYIWQVLFPLFIIILASFVIFWIDDFATQLGVGFTLMLTVVAFNFYSASILPQLPYQTFIETIIIVGYIFIFLGILGVVINYRIFGDKDKSGFNKLIKMFRYLFPVAFVVILYFMFYVYDIV